MRPLIVILALAVIAFLVLLRETESPGGAGRAGREGAAPAQVASSPISGVRPLDEPEPQQQPTAKGRSAPSFSQDTVDDGDTPQDLREELESLRQQYEAVSEERDRLQRELTILKYPEDTPWGHALMLPDMEQITPEEGRRLRALLDEYPFMLRPGEALWIVERDRANDWKAYGLTVEEGLIRFLGVERVVEDFPPDLVAEVKRSCAELFERWAGSD